jgi:Leucine-rich repeat (LRR) protein
MKFASSCMAAWLSFLLIMHSSCVPTTNAGYIDDATALKRFFEVSDGPRWINSTNWMSDANVCTWFGITCDASSKRVTEITLPGNNLVGRIAKLVYQMESLTSIALKDNVIHDADFPGFAEAAGKGGESQLQNFDLAGNSLTSLAGIGGAPTTLQHLHLTENNLQGTLPLELFSLTNIQNVFLSFNHLTGTLPTEIGKLEFLESLYLYSNDLTGTIPSEVGLLTTVKILTLAENKFTGSLPSQVSDMINLETFSAHNHILKKGKLTGSLPSFEKSPFLSEIKLDGNAIEGDIPSQLMDSSNVTSSLVTIGLSDNLLTGSLPTSLLKFSSLYLDVTGNQITEVDPKFCQQGAWMSGLVEELGCDALLCPENSWNIDGRATQDLNCTECSSSLFFGATVCESAPLPLMHDWVALARLYQALDGPHWNKTQGWKELDALLDTSNWEEINATSFNVCLWHGIDCENGESVKGIALKNNGLVGTLPTEIFSMTGLKVLDLSLNTIQVDETLGLSAIANAKALLQIDLSGTKILNIQGIDTAPALTSVFLDGLELPNGPFPNQLLAMTRLEYLHLQYSGLTGTLPTEIGTLSKLKS